jgi:hypothetical protein
LISQAGQALEALAETATQYDADGIDIHFLNSKSVALNMKVCLPASSVNS